MSFPKGGCDVHISEKGWPLRLREPLEYLWQPKIDRPELDRAIVVPSGFVTDLASVPRVFWRILPPFGAYALAAIVHDWLYHNQPSDWTRKQADEVFRDAMKDLGVAAWKRKVMYRAVRIGGPRWLLKEK